eukprot:Em0004g320a
MLEKAIGISQVDEESKKQAKVLKDETTTTQSTMAIMKDKEEQNTLKRHRSEDTTPTMDTGTFLWIRAEGISPDPEKVKAINQMPPPEDKKGVERLLGFLNYVAKFIPDLSSITQPIRELLKKECPFSWNHEQEIAFQLIKKRMTSALVLAFYDVKKPVTVSCDVSNFGLVHMTVALYSTPTSDVRLQEIIEATKKDNTMQSLRQIVRSGWPEKRTQVPKEVQEYWNVRDKISETDGLIMKWEQLVIPTGLRTEMLKRIHMDHMGIVKCSQRAKELMFWPGMYEAIENMEPTIPGPTPKHPWEEIATDLFHWSGHDYLIIVDYFSRYIELCKLEDTSCKSIVTHTKSVLAQHGIPMVIRSDNGPQYTAEEYKRFTKEWGIQDVTTSPYHPQANGLAEKSVQIIQSLLNKSKANNQDPYLSLLEYCSTTVDNVGSSAQLHRATLPVTASPLKLGLGTIRCQGTAA